MGKPTANPYVKPTGFTNYVSFLIVKLYHYIVHRGNNYIDVNGSNHNEYYENVCTYKRA